MKKLLVVVGCAAVLSGCNFATTHYDCRKDGLTAKQYQQDDWECRHFAKQAAYAEAAAYGGMVVAPNEGEYLKPRSTWGKEYVDCMRFKGYEVYEFK